MAGVTVMIPTRNRAGFLGGAIQSVIAQTHRPLEVLISDNCSSDNTREVVEKYAAESPAGITFTIFHQSLNIGPLSNHVFTVEKAAYDYCCFLHDDDRFSDRLFLADAVSILEGSGNCFACVGNTTLRDVISGEAAEGTMLSTRIAKDTDAWQMLDGASFVFALGWGVGYPSYSAITFNRKVALSKGAFRFPFIVGNTESARLGIAEEEGLCFLYLLAAGHTIGFKNRPVTERLTHAGQLAREPHVLKTTHASLLLLYGNLCERFIRDAHVPSVKARQWLVTVLWRNIAVPFDTHNMRTLFAIKPGLTVLHLLLQIPRRPYVWVRLQSRLLSTALRRRFSPPIHPSA